MPGRRRALVPSAALGLLLADAAPAQAHAGHHTHAAPSATPASPNAGRPAYERFVKDMHDGMDQMMRAMHADPPSGNPDIDFLVMMIPHHAGAVDMARLVLRHGSDPVVREIAELILAAQLGEIAGMQGRLAHLRSGASSYPALTGNRGTP